MISVVSDLIGVGYVQIHCELDHLDVADHAQLLLELGSSGTLGSV